MRKIYKMAGLTCLGLILASQSINAQTQVIIANGGQFESTAPFADRATVGSYDMTSKTFTVFDTIHVESINGTVIDNEHAYVGAFDTLVKYDIDNYTRLTTTHVDKIKNVYLSGNMLFTSLFNGAGAPLMKSLNKTTLATEFSFNDLEENIGGVAVLNDSIYIASNVPGTVDAFPPFGIFTDTLGVISVFNANTGAFSRKIQLGTDGAGVNDLIAYNNNIHAVCKETGNVIEYNTTTGATIATNVGASGLDDNYSNILIIETATGVDKYDMDTRTMLNQGFTISAIAEVYDNINDEYYFTQSDFASYGKTFIHDINGTALDSFDVNISPQGIAIDYRTPVGMNNLETTVDQEFSIYPNPAKENISLSLRNSINTLQVIDVAGRILISKNNLSHGVHTIRINELNEGIYFVRTSNENEIKVKRLIIQ
ncbi:MAG: T9SS type A sorting domain-containing protein [Vicingaceae bacterium]|nr:T9SS type A sorting domain-containing protein [Vicingaceae bacterium]